MPKDLVVDCGAGGLGGLPDQEPRETPGSGPQDPMVAPHNAEQFPEFGWNPPQEPPETTVTEQVTYDMDLTAHAARRKRRTSFLRWLIRPWTWLE